MPQVLGPMKPPLFSSLSPSKLLSFLDMTTCTLLGSSSHFLTCRSGGSGVGKEDLEADALPCTPPSPFQPASRLEFGSRLFRATDDGADLPSLFTYLPSAQMGNLLCSCMQTISGWSSAVLIASPVQIVAGEAWLLHEWHERGLP